MKTLWFCLFAAVLPAAAFDYHREIAPIFRAYCAGCHNDRELEGDLSMETYAALRKGGEKGDPLATHEKGPLLRRVIESTGKSQMPPKDEPQLPKGELDILKRWIAAGGPGPAEDTPLFQKLSVPKVAAAMKGEHPVNAAAFSPDGQWLAVARGNWVELRDAEGKNVVRRIEGFPGKVNALQFSPDGKQVLAASGVAGLNGVAQMRKVEDGSLVREFTGASDVLYDAEFSPDGNTVATAGYDRVIRMYQAGDARLIRSIDVHKGAVFDLAFHPSGTILASASADFTVKLWRVRDGERLDTLNQPLAEQMSVLFSKDGNYVIGGGADKRIHLWKLVSREKPALNPLLLARFAHEAPVTRLSESADGKWLLSTADDRTLKMWSLPEVIEQHAWSGAEAAAQVLVTHPRQPRFVVGRMDGKLTSEALPNAERNMAARAELLPPEPLASEISEISEQEPNNTAAQSQRVSLPVAIKGSIQVAGDQDHFRFTAKAGQQLVLDVDAASAGSKLDSKLEILSAEGQPVEQVVLQAVKDSWFTFRGKDSMTSDDFRVQNWREMELNEYLYCNGEVVKLWMYPRGPDSGFRVYPGSGNRQTYFQTTPHAHALGEFCYIVQSLPPGSTPPPNGLPVFRLNYENDDEPGQKRGPDSLLTFTAPADGEYIARIRDVRGFGNAKGFEYTLRVRNPAPTFTVTVEGRDPKISPGSGREITFKVTRTEGFEGPVKLEIANVPASFRVTSPVVIEAGQLDAQSAIYAEDGAMPPDEAAWKAVKISATASVAGKELVKELGNLGKIQLAPKPKLTVEILPKDGATETGKPPVFEIRPGETITARVRIRRHDFKNRVGFGNDDSGRNLPHGVFVDNIGLNGLLIVEGQTEREFSITAAPMAQPMERHFHLKAGEDGGQVSAPAVIRVLPRKADG